MSRTRSSIFDLKNKTFSRTQKMAKTLKDLTADTIILNLNSYDGDEISKLLSPPSREMVLQRMMLQSKTNGAEKFRNMWTKLHLLMSYATKSIDTRSLTNIITDPDDDCTSNDQILKQALELIASNAPDLSDLHVSSPQSESYNLQPSEVSLICEMKNLTHLSFGTPFKPLFLTLIDLLTITRECNNLETINAYCSENDVAFLSERIFPYQAIDAIDFEYISVVFAKHLPQNLTAGGPYFCWSARLSDETDLNFLENALTRHSNGNMMNCDQSKIKSAQFFCEEKSSPLLMRFLKANGQNLDELKVQPATTLKQTITSDVTLAQVFNWCGNLSTFQMRYVQVTSFDVPSTALTRLRKFTWLCNSETQGFQITSILSAPLLEEVEIEDTKLDVSEDLLYKIRRREILQNLKKFVFYDLGNSSERIDLLCMLKSTMPRAQVQHYVRSRKGYKLLKKH
ncbi:Hypothetical predicted protein [Cloeon dipterum]|uniref:Uncharacterized protein n=1 Tax=Cloeon dipterum TaxID=197152 RepID=A0A8S1E0G0_9INSE|nr:Hypothetical predicted protein [Cloeon dipterum]